MFWLDLANAYWFTTHKSVDFERSALKDNIEIYPQYCSNRTYCDVSVVLFAAVVEKSSRGPLLTTASHLSISSEHRLTAWQCQQNRHWMWTLEELERMNNWTRMKSRSLKVRKAKYKSLVGEKMSTIRGKLVKCLSKTFDATLSDREIGEKCKW